MPNAPAGFATATWTPVRCSECSGRVTELCSNGPVTTRSFGLINPFSAMFSASVQFNVKMTCAGAGALNKAAIACRVSSTSFSASTDIR